MSDYSVDHASTLLDVADAGAAVTFSYTTAGTYDPLTDTTSGAEAATVTGSAIESKSSPIRYQALGLVQSEAPTLFFVPDTYGEIPPLGATVTWGGIDYTVKDVDPLAPAGVAIAASIVVAR